MAASKKNELVLVTDKYPGLAVAGDVKEAAEVNFAGDPNMDGPSWTDFERLKVQGGGAPGLEIYDPLADESKHAKELTLLPLLLKHSRMFYIREEDDKDAELGGPPDCSSVDGVFGEGVIERDGESKRRKCATCPLAQWDSGKNGGQACKSMAVFFVFREPIEGEKDEPPVLPSILQVPTMSLRPLRRFLQALTARGLPFFAVELVVKTSMHQGAGKTKYSKLEWKLKRKLNGDERAAAKLYFEGLREQFATHSMRDMLNDLNAAEKRTDVRDVSDDAPGDDYPGADDEELEAAAAGHDEEIPF